MGDIESLYFDVMFCLYAISFVSGVISIIVAAKIARKKSFNVAGWAVFAFFCGWIPVIIVACIPAKHKKYDIAYNQSRYDKNPRIVCPNCGSYATGNEVFCDMCGTKLNRPPQSSFWRTNATPPSNSNAPATPIVKKTIPIPKVEKYTCDGCGELIDTVQCPWCGRKKK